MRAIGGWQAAVLLTAVLGGTGGADVRAQAPPPETQRQMVDAAAAALTYAERREGTFRPAGRPFLQTAHREVYRVDVEDYLVATRGILAAGLNAPDLEAMRSYVEATFPQLDQRAVITHEWAPDGTVPQPALVNLVKAVTSYIQKLRSLDRLAQDLDIATTPSGAAVEIRPKSGTRTTSTTSNARLSNVYRGLYVYSVNKNGFKPVTGDLNLIDDRSEVLSCSLVATTAPGEPLPCSRQ